MEIEFKNNNNKSSYFDLSVKFFIYKLNKELKIKFKYYESRYKSFIGQ